MNPATAPMFDPSESSPRSPYAPSVSRGSDDVVDLLALTKAVLATWKAWLIAAVLASIVFGGYQVLSYLSGLKNAPYTKVISLTFNGADRGQYPNGAPYRIQDIAAPAVLQSVYEALNIAASGLSMPDFRNRISIEPYTPYYREIMAKYNALLDATNQNYDEIQALQERKRNELNKALSSSVLISFDPAGAKLSEATVREAITRIPLEWARQSIVDKGVLKANIQLVSGETLSPSLFENVDYVVLSDLFSMKIRALRENIAKITALSGSSTVSDPETGWTLSDLESNLHDLEAYKINSLMSPIRSLGLSRNPRLAAFYFKEKQEILRENLTQLEEESALIQAAYKSYSPEKTLAFSEEGGARNGMGAYPGMVPQVGGDVLDKLLTVAGEDSIEKYRQVLNDRWLATNLTIAEVKGDLRNIDRLIVAVEGNGADSLMTELRDEYLRQAEADIPDIVSRLHEFYDISWRIYKQISRERVGSVGYLYKDGHQGVLRGSVMPSLKHVILIYIALITVLTFVVVPVVLIRNGMKARRQAETAIGE